MCDMLCHIIYDIILYHTRGIINMQSNRLFQIIYILLNKKTVSAGKLAEQLGVSRRTICRDIDTLSLAGVPIYTEKGKYGGVSLLPEYVLCKSVLSEQEQNEILSSLHGLSNIKTDDTEGVLQKLCSIFNKTATNWLEVDYSAWAHERDYFNDFKTAILERRVAEFDYYNSYGDKTFRRVEPMRLWFKSKSWYIKGFCLTKNDMRLYKLSRIKNLVVTDEHFIERDPLALSDSFAQAQDFHEGQQIVEIKLRIERQMAYRVYGDFYEGMVEKQKDGSFIVTIDWPEDQWLYGFILSFGDYMEVLEPEHIRKIIKSKAEKIAKKYL